MAGSFEDGGGPVEHLFGDVELTAGLPPAPATAARQVTLAIGVVQAGPLGPLGVGGEHLAVRSRRPLDDRQVTLSCGDGGRSSCSLDRVRRDGVLGFGESVSGVGPQVGEPVRDQTSTRLA